MSSDRWEMPDFLENIPTYQQFAATTSVSSESHTYSTIAAYASRDKAKSIAEFSKNVFNFNTDSDTEALVAKSRQLSDLHGRLTSLINAHQCARQELKWYNIFGRISAWLVSRSLNQALATVNTHNVETLFLSKFASKNTEKLNCLYQHLGSDEEIQRIIRYNDIPILKKAIGNLRSKYETTPPDKKDISEQHQKINEMAKFIEQEMQRAPDTPETQIPENSDQSQKCTLDSLRSSITTFYDDLRSNNKEAYFILSLLPKEKQLELTTLVANGKTIEANKIVNTYTDLCKTLWPWRPGSNREILKAFLSTIDTQVIRALIDNTIFNSGEKKFEGFIGKVIDSFKASILQANDYQSRELIESAANEFNEVIAYLSAACTKDELAAFTNPQPTEIKDLIIQGDKEGKIIGKNQLTRKFLEDNHVLEINRQYQELYKTFELNTPEQRKLLAWSHISTAKQRENLLKALKDSRLTSVIKQLKLEYGNVQDPEDRIRTEAKERIAFLHELVNTPPNGIPTQNDLQQLFSAYRQLYVETTNLGDQNTTENMEAKQRIDILTNFTKKPQFPITNDILAVLPPPLKNRSGELINAIRLLDKENAPLHPSWRDVLSKQYQLDKIKDAHLLDEDYLNCQDDETLRQVNLRLKAAPSKLERIQQAINIYKKFLSKYNDRTIGVQKLITELEESAKACKEKEQQDWKDQIVVRRYPDRQRKNDPDQKSGS